MEPIEWHGISIVVSFGEWLGIGLINAILKSESDKHSEGALGMYLIILGGLTVSPNILTGYTTGIDLETPGIWGPNAYVLLGGVGWVSATATEGGSGVSATPIFRMGSGKGTNGLSAVIGYGVCIDAMSGVSVPAWIDNESYKIPEFTDYGSGGGASGSW